MSAAEILAVTCLALAIYHYAGYPLLMIVAARLKPRRSPPPDPSAATERFTLVIAAYNEERVIEEKLRNALSLSYPSDKLSVIVAADGSSDRTAELVEACGDPRVRCLHSPIRRGKGHALNRAVAAATGDIVVLSDANNMYSADALQLLAARLRAPGVGGVTGAKKVIADVERAASVGDSLYWRYESQIKAAESELGGVVTADGEIFAMRRADYEPISENVVNDDMHLTLSLVRRGLRVEYEPRAIALEEGSLTIRDDFNVKVRMIAGGVQNLRRDWRAICSSSSFLFKFVSHKLARWTMPVFLLLLLLSSAASAGRPFFAALLAGQVLFYTMATVGAVLDARGARPLLFYVPFYFTAMNLAAAKGLVKAFRGKHSPLWQKAVR